MLTRLHRIGCTEAMLYMEVSENRSPWCGNVTPALGDAKTVTIVALRLVPRKPNKLDGLGHNPHAECPQLLPAPLLSGHGKQAF